MAFRFCRNRVVAARRRTQRHGAARAAGQTVTVSAAISLKEALADIVSAYGKSSGDTVEINVGASGTLAGQIRAGAPVDLFISAGQ